MCSISFIKYVFQFSSVHYFLKKNLWTYNEIPTLSVHAVVGLYPQILFFLQYKLSVTNSFHNNYIWFQINFLYTPIAPKPDHGLDLQLSKRVDFTQIVYFSDKLLFGFLKSTTQHWQFYFYFLKSSRVLYLNPKLYFKTGHPRF